MKRGEADKVSAVLDRLAVIQMNTAREVAAVCRRVDELADAIQTQWDEFQQLRGELDHMLTLRTHPNAATPIPLSAKVDAPN